MIQNAPLSSTVIDTPVGPLTVIASDAGVRAVVAR